MFSLLLNFKSCYLYFCYCKNLSLQYIFHGSVSLILLNHFFHYFMMKSSKSLQFTHTITPEFLSLELKVIRSPLVFHSHFPPFLSGSSSTSSQGIHCLCNSYTLCSPMAPPLTPFTFFPSSSTTASIAKVRYVCLWCHTV